MSAQQPSLWTLPYFQKIYSLGTSGASPTEASGLGSAQTCSSGREAPGDLSPLMEPG